MLKSRGAFHETFAVLPDHSFHGNQYCRYSITMVSACTQHSMRFVKRAPGHAVFLFGNRWEGLLETCWQSVGLPGFLPSFNAVRGQIDRILLRYTQCWQIYVLSLEVLKYTFILEGPLHVLHPCLLHVYKLSPHIKLSHPGQCDFGATTHSQQLHQHCLTNHETLFSVHVTRLGL